MLHALALTLGRYAARILDPVRSTQAMAMFAELEHLKGAQALAWALGCLAASCRLRASFIAVGIVGARLCIATAAGLFGFVHVIASSSHLWTKIQIITGGVQAPCRAEITCTIASQPLGHWIWMFLIFWTLGLLHVLASALMATGRNESMLKLAIAIVGVDLVMPFAGMSGSSLPVLYIGLIMLMAFASFGLAFLWRWDERRIALAQSRRWV